MNLILNYAYNESNYRVEIGKNVYLGIDISHYGFLNLHLESTALKKRFHIIKYNL